MANARNQIVSVTVDTSLLAAKLSPALYAGAVRGLISSAALTAERHAKSATPTDMGALRRSIHSDVKPTSATVGTSLAYARPVEYGRRPGARMPPPEALVGWMRRHGMTGSPYVLARAIARRGTKGRFFMRAGMQATVAALPSLTRLAARRVEAAWRAERAGKK